MKHNFLKYILIRLLYIILIPIIIYNLIIVVQTIIKPNSVPNVFGIKTFDIISSSMAPMLNVNDLAFVKTCNIEDLNENDVITFKTESGYITHRISKINTENGKISFVTKGDSNKVVDIKTVDFSQVEGKFFGKIPKVGSILVLLRNKDIFLLIISFLALIYFYKKKKIYKKIYRKEKRTEYDLNNT